MFKKARKVQVSWAKEAAIRAKEVASRATKVASKALNLAHSEADEKCRVSLSLESNLSAFLLICHGSLRIG